MSNNHLEIVKNNSYYYNNIDKISFNFECLIFDTESCTNKKDDNTGARVYGWGLGCTRSKQMIYGETLNQFFCTMEQLLHNNTHLIKIKKKKKKYPSEHFVKIPIAIHNLGWDIEFLKYEMFAQGYNYQKGILKTIVKDGISYQSTVTSEKEKTFHIVQADNVVYGANVYTSLFYNHANKDGSTTKVGLELDMFDSYKIITTGVDNFNNYVHGVDEMFYKMKEEYDYSAFREKGHIQTDLELRYQYNDIYMLREVIEQFYIDNLCEGEMPTLGKRTASSIAFDKLKRMTFGEEKTNEMYENYFEINQTTRFEITRQRIENASYSGGFTHANKKYVTQHLTQEGCSLDINSSYPSQMAYKIFPHGKPKKGKYGEQPTSTEKEVFLIEVGFDFVKPKKKEFDLAIFKIGALNSKRLKDITGEVSGQEYFSTNVVNDSVYIPIHKHLDNTKLNTNYNIVLTSIEYDFWLNHYDFGYTEIDEFGCEITTPKLNYNGLLIGEVLIYKAEKGKFKGFVEHFTELKVTSKKEGNIPMTNQAKLFLNSAYGKFGSRQDKIEKNLILDKNGLLTFTSDDEICYRAKEYYRPYASFVTAYGRLQLWNAIVYAVGVDNFIYCDTDSIYCLRNVDELVNDMNSIGEYIDPTTLGMWDVETVFNEFKVLGQKKYMYKLSQHSRNKKSKGKLKVKCCGLPKEGQNSLVKEGFSEFYLGKEVDGKNQKKKVIGGYLLLPTKFRIKRIAF